MAWLFIIIIIVKTHTHSTDVPNICNSRERIKITNVRVSVSWWHTYSVHVREVAVMFDLCTAFGVAPPPECQTITVNSLSRLISLAYSQFTCVPFSALLAPATFYACNRRSLNFVYFSILFFFRFLSLFFPGKFNMLCLMPFSVLFCFFFSFPFWCSR